MPLVAAAVCPHPPLIVPELAGAAAPELDALRVACDTAVAGLYAAGATTVVVVGSGERTADLDSPYRGSFAPWGLPLEVRLGDRPDGAIGTDGLPLSLLVGAWLLRRVPLPAGRTASVAPVTPPAGRTVQVAPPAARTPNAARTPPAPAGWRMVSVAPDAPMRECAAAGARIGSDQPWALLVMGDGSACHGPTSPGYDDPRAGAYDDGVARALADADAEALLGLDPVRSAELRVAGRAPWQVLAGAVRATGGDWRGELRHHSAPYGVGYFVASWERA
ncbi:hypothetical protein [Micromonospora sp. NPDC092111]|uniref:hypothetical protein n=1 Tax=Micromonospora sp. NPDC092111 TaxID=3364289 RepID=UPI0038035C25